MTLEVVDMGMGFSPYMRTQEEMSGLGDEIALLEGGFEGLELALWGTPEEALAEVGLGSLWGKAKKAAKKAAKTVHKASGGTILQKAAKVTYKVSGGVIVDKLTQHGGIVGEAARSIKMSADVDAQLNTLLHKRRGAVVKAATEKKRYLAQTQMLDREVGVLVPSTIAAMKRGDTAKARLLAMQLQKKDALRKTYATRAVRFAKVEALGQTLTKNTKTQINMLRLAARAAKAGKAEEAKVLTNAMRSIGKNTQHLKQLRAKQIVGFSQATAKARRAAASIAVQSAREEVNALQSQGMPVPAELAEELEDREVRVDETGGELDDPMANIGFEGLEAEAAFAQELAGLGGNLFKKAKAKFKSAGAALKNTAKTIGKKAKAVANKAKAAIKKAAKAAKDLLKKGACALSKNPAVLKAAGSAVGTIYGGPVGTAVGAKAGDVASKLMGGACSSKAQEEETAGSETEEEKKGSGGTIALAAGGAGLLALVFLL